MNEPRPPLRLTTEDKHSALWRKLTEHFEYRLSALRAQNDGDQNEQATAKLRGRIAEVKSVLDLNTDRPTE